MENLAVYDRKDYDLSMPRFIRNAVRAIVVTNNKNIALIYNKKYGVYVFPGGGIEDGETHFDALIRETKEEAGLIVKRQTIKEFGAVTEIKKDKYADKIYELHDLYYTCEVEDYIAEQDLEEIEKECGFQLAFVSFDEAIAANEAELQRGIKVLEGTTYVLKLLKRKFLRIK